MLTHRASLGATLIITGFTLLLVAIAAPSAVAGRSLQVTRTLDYLHAHQAADGRFQDAAYTPWAIIAIAACGENPDGKAWSPSGKSPLDYLQSIDLEANMAGGTTANAPAYYAKMILAYVAAGRRSSLSGAGSRRIDLVSKLLAHQRADGRVCPTAASDHIGAVNATIWAVIALEAAGTNATAQARAVAWLKGQQLTDGGFANMAKDGPGTPVSDVDDTAAAIQALIGGGVARDSSIIKEARAYLSKAQRADGGFSSAHTGGYTYSESTGWALQAILALGESPTASSWTKGGKNVRDALNGLQSADGSMQHRAGVTSTVMLSTTQSLVALAGKTFSSFPRGSTSWTTPFSWAPRITSLSPANGATVGSTTVLVKAAYSDGSGGTGVASSGVRLTVDGRDMTKQARVSGSSLSVKLTGATAGKHTIKILVRDRAGNSRSVTHAVTVGSNDNTGGSSGSTASAASAGQAAQATASTSGASAAARSGGSDTPATAADEMAAVNAEFDPVDGTSDVPEAAFPSAGTTDAASSPGGGPADAFGSAASQSEGGDQAAEAGAAAGRSSSDDGRYALMLVGIGLVPVAMGFGIAGRYHHRWWEAIGKPHDRRSGR